MLMLGTLRFRLGSLRPTRESTRTSLISQWVHRCHVPVVHYNTQTPQRPKMLLNNLPSCRSITTRQQEPKTQKQQHNWYTKVNNTPTLSEQPNK
jgi:hypothetical protein